MNRLKTIKVISLLFVLTLPAVMSGQTLTFKGVVIDEGGEPLVGVSIAEKGGKTLGVTDLDGAFSVGLAQPGELQFSYVGMKTEEVSVRRSEERRIVMRSATTELDDVVVVGYGTQRKINLTGAVQSIDGGELTKRSVSNISTALQGVVPGLTAIQSSGQPGADNAAITIRGRGSLNSSTSPLVLIDGVEGDMNRIDMSTVESVSVLKDAASASIYGSRASNGVILITTKRGSSGKLKVSYNGYVGLSTPTNLPEPLGAIDYMRQMDKAYRNNGQAPIYTEAIEAYENGLVDNYNYYETDWKDLVLKSNALQHSHSVSVGGGTDFIRVFANAGYFWQDGIIDNNTFKRTTLRLNSDMNIRPWLKLGLDVHFRETTAKRPSQDDAASIIGNALTMTPISSGIGSDGTWGYGRTGYNPLAIIKEGGLRTDNAPELTLRGTLDANPIDGLNLHADYTRRILNSEGSSFVRPYDTYEGGRFLMTYPATASDGKRVEDRAKTINQQFVAQVSYEKKIKEHYFKVLGVFQTEKMDYYWLTASRSKFEFDGYDDLMHGDATTAGNSSSRAELAQMSYVFRANYNYTGKYLFEASGRYDGTSRFMKGNRWGFFPSVSAGWRLSEESFFEPAREVVDNLKIRASYGTMGNQSIGGYYPYAAAVNTSGGTVNYYFDGKLIPGIEQAALANEMITWEKSRQFDVGVDLAMLHSRLTLTADYYIRYISDMLQQFPAPAFAGMTAPWQNAGSMRNNGWELSIGWRDRVADFAYGVRLNLSDVKNTVTDLYGNEYVGTTITKEGVAIGSYYGYVADGFFQSQEEINAAESVYGGDKTAVKPGFIRYVDVDGNGAVNSNDRVVLGNSTPRYEFGLNFDASWKGFDLALFFQGVGKRDLFYSGAGVRPLVQNSTMYASQLDTWSEDNRDAEYPLLLVDNGSTNMNNIISSFWIKNGAYLRLKNLTIGYSLPKKLLAKAYIDRLRFYVSAQNLFTICDGYKGYDPESGAGTSLYPIMKTFSFGVNLDF